MAADFARSTADQMAEHRARVAACRDQAERAGVATSGARQSLGEAVVAAEQAKARGAGAGAVVVPGWAGVCWWQHCSQPQRVGSLSSIGCPLPVPCLQAAERIAAVAVRDAETRAERLQADLHRLVASQGERLVGAAAAWAALQPAHL